MKLLKQVRRVVGANLGAPRPVYAHWGVTHRCNMRCRMCVVWKSADRDRELTAAQADVLAHNLAQAGFLTVALGGGEPFVRQDLADLVASFARRGMEVRVLTNGIGIPDARLEEVVGAGVSHVSISLDTLDPAKEQDLYGGADVWEEVVDSMRRFRARLPRRSVPVMNVCVSALNVDELPALVDFAARAGFFCSFVPIALSPSPERTDGFAAAAPDLAIGASHIEALDRSYAALLELKRRGAPIANSSRFLRDSYTHLRSGAMPWKCDAGLLYLSISPEGDISSCHHWPAFAGFDTPRLRDVLRDDAVRARFARERESCKGCMRPCWAEVTHAVHDLRSAWEAFHMFRQGSWPGGGA